MKSATKERRSPQAAGIEGEQTEPTPAIASPPAFSPMMALLAPTVKKEPYMARTYLAHSKHGGSPGARGVRGSPMDLSDGDAQSLLNNNSLCFEEPGKKQF